MQSDLACRSDEREHAHDPAGFIRTVERACQERGLRLTPIRASIMRLIAQAGKPIKAYDLLQLVGEGQHFGAKAPPTVYRALDFLIANGFVHKLASINAFVTCHHPHKGEHSFPFLICNCCHSAVELDDHEVIALLEKRANALGFQSQAQTLEVHGLCAACAARETHSVESA